MATKKVKKKPATLQKAKPAQAKPGRGGAREGAGRRPLVKGKKMVRRNLVLLPGTIKKAKRIGGGKNFSAGVRIAVAAFQIESKKKPIMHASK